MKFRVNIEYEYEVDVNDATTQELYDLADRDRVWIETF